MNLTIPIYVETHKPQGQPAPLFVCRALFVPGPPAQDPRLNRALNKLVKQLKRQLDHLAQEPRHEEFLDATFNPDLSDHRIDLTLDLRSGWQRCRLSLVVFRALERRIAFSPSLPEIWFEVLHDESLEARANRVYEQYFRQCQREDRDVPRIIAEATLKGQAWVTTVELSVKPTTKKKPDFDRTLASLFGNDVADGATELENVGRCLDWLYPDDLARALGRGREVDELVRLLSAEQRRPILLLGPRQSGKTTIVHEYVHRIVASRKSPYAPKHNVWLLSPQRLIAGMSYLGQWEQRLLAILKTARKQDHVLYFNDLLGAYRAGVSRDSSLCVADVLKPYVERGEVRVVGEMTSEAWQVWRERDRSFADLFHILPVAEPDDRQTLRILIAVVRQLEGRHGARFDLDALPSAIELTRRYLRDAAFPGKAAVFLEHVAAKYPDAEVSQETIHREFAAKTGLGASFADRRKKLPREEVLAALGREIIGQRQAVETVADVVAIAKAQLNDPRRPLGTLLFVGPTGVGKTQLAKTLAGYLFGDQQRLLRFDMNEFVSPGSAARLVGTFADPEGLLTSAVRRQPFCVVLLDEIEKAHPDVLDLLLQVMGEGRLTDSLGRTTDFGNAIVILTSNLGTREASSTVGFRHGPSSDATHFCKAAERFFRPEFFNRLDRVVPFDRLSRDEVREIAELVIRGVFQREGLLRRKCVLEVDPRALDQVVERGYHPTLGARALKREVERQLTQPVSMRLAATRPDAATVVSLFPAQAGIAVQVQSLVDAEPACPADSPASNGHDRQWCAERLSALAALLTRIESQLADQRPGGSIVPGQIPLEHYHYFLLKERSSQLRHEAKNLAEQIQRAGRTGPLPAMIGTARRRGLAKWGAGGRRLLRELASVDDIHAYLREAAGAATGFGHHFDQQVQQLLHEAALLKTMMLADRTSETVAVVIIAARGEGATWAEGLARCYVELFGDSLSLDCQPLTDEGPLRALTVSGPHALAVAGIEQGTHLFCPKQANLVPVPVSVLSAAEGEATQVVAEFAQRRRAWIESLVEGTGTVNDDPHSLLPVVRVYTEDGPTFDLRSGLSAPGRISTEALRSFVLAALPPPDELKGA